MHEKSETIASVCALLDDNNKQNAVKLLRTKAALMPIIKQLRLNKEFIRTGNVDSIEAPSTVTKRQYTAFESTCLFISDGFIDRYEGERLVFPGVLRLLSDIFPDEFPYHPNWKSGACHQWYWELFPTVDHIVPVTLAGLDERENWVTTSMFNNLMKSNNTLDHLGWSVFQRGDFNEWDGLIHWFVKYLVDNPEWLQKSHIKNWYKAADKALKTLNASDE